jgi:hypothetical protein
MDRFICANRIAINSKGGQHGHHSKKRSIEKEIDLVPENVLEEIEHVMIKKENRV